MSNKGKPGNGARLAYLIVGLGWMMVAIPFLWLAGVLLVSAVLTFIGQGIWVLAVLFGGMLLVFAGLVIAAVLDFFGKK